LNQFGKFENLIRGCLHATFAQVSHALYLGSLDHLLAGLTVPAVIVCVNAEARAIQSGSDVPITKCVLTQSVCDLNYRPRFGHRPLVESDFDALGIDEVAN
jgi:hypothetical protein